MFYDSGHDEPRPEEEEEEEGHQGACIVTMPLWSSLPITR
jgi:hypothetical protein